MTTAASSGSPLPSAAPPRLAADSSAAALSPELARVARGVASRLRLRRVLVCSSWGLGIGAGLTLAAVAAMRLRLWEMPDEASDLWFLAPPILGLALGAVWGAAWRIAPLAALRYADTRLGLNERLSTAASAALYPASFGDTAFADRQKSDADEYAGRADARAVVPLRPLPQTAFWATGIALTAFLVWFLPTLPLFQSAQTRAEHETVKKQGERLVRIAKALDKEAGKKKLPEAHKAALQMAALGKQLQKGAMTKQKALMKVAKLTTAMKQAQAALAAQTGVPKSLPAASKEMAQALSKAQQMPKQNDPNTKSGLNAPAPGGDAKAKDGKSAASAQSAAQKMQQALAENNAPSLAEALTKMADDAAQGKPGDKAGQEAMAKQVAALADALKNTSLSAASAPLQAAAEALKKGDMAQAAQKLREAAQKIGEAQNKGDDKNAMEKMANALGQSGMSDAIEGAQMGEAGEGEGDGDAFGKDGVKKGRGKGKGPGDGGEFVMGGDGEGDGSVNGIGTGAGKLGGKKPPVGKAGKYLDAKDAPKENALLNRKTETHQVRDDNFSRLYVPGPNSTKLNGKRGDKGKETVSFFRGAPDKASSSVPYYEVYGRYAPAAESALSRDDIPQAYKKQVKNYFDALRPEPNGGAKK